MDILELLIGGGLLAFIQWAFDKWSEYRGKKNKTAQAIEDLGKQINKLQETMEEQVAVNARTHILRFNDELYNGQEHSKDYFEQVIEDIDAYERYCSGHPLFKNGVTVLAVKNIKETYDRLTKEHKFL